MAKPSIESLFERAASLAEELGADGILALVDSPADWAKMRKRVGETTLLVASERTDALEGAAIAGLHPIPIDAQDQSIDRLMQALLKGIAMDVIKTGHDVVAMYGAFDSAPDSISVVRVGEHLGRLTGKDLRGIESLVPPETLESVVDLAMEIGREGREGKPVGTMFVVGDSRRVMRRSRPTGFDPVRGYRKKDRNLRTSKVVQEGLKEIAQLDGAIIVQDDGVVLAAGRYLDAPADGVSLSKGLGARHWAAAAISKATRALAITVSESSGTVRIFQNGDVALRIEPFRRPMKWKPQAAPAS